MRVAFFGGSFDPPHLGHLHIALAACERLGLDRVLLAPVGRQPLKTHEAAPFADRMAMLRLLTAGHARLEASAVDGPLGAAGAKPDDTPNYTVDTLARLRPALEEGAALFFLAGADSFLTLPHWHRPEALLGGDAGGLLDGWILAARPGFPFEALAGALPKGYGLRQGAASAGPVLTERVVLPDGGAAVPLYLLPDLEDPSTATSIRAAFAAGRAAPHLPASILEYIEERGLYGVR